MESLPLLGFKDTTTSGDIEDKSLSSSSSWWCGYKLVPWISWDDWTFVRVSLFSSSPDSIASAIRRVSSWRSRGCVPVLIEVTASILEIQQKDPFFRDDLNDNDLQSEEILTMLYCMTIMRLVNGVVEKTRKKTEVSIAVAADLLGIPRMLIDIRHECSHRELPSLRLVRLASTKALEWLKSYYWEPQRFAIQNPSEKTANLTREIKSKIRELAFTLNVKQASQSSSSVLKGKRIKHSDPLCKRNKLLSHMAVKHRSYKPVGCKKQINKLLKNFVRLYSSFSSEVVSVFLEFLLKALDSAYVVDLPKSSQPGHSTGSFHSVFDDWMPVIVKLSNKEPEMLLTLLKAVLQMIETQKASKYDLGREDLVSKSKDESHQTEQLSLLFEWLVSTLKELKPSRLKISAAESDVSPEEMNLPKATIMDLLRKCLLVSCPGNGRLMASAQVLAQMAGNNSLVQKLNKLACLSDVYMDEDNSSITTSESFLLQQEDSICQAAEELKVFKLKRNEENKLKTMGSNTRNQERWVGTKSWNPCPIGMLPSTLGSSGLLPVLDYDEEVDESSGSKDNWELKRCRGKREADCSIEVCGNSIVKRMKESESNGKDNALLAGVKGRLMIGGVWKRVTEEELLAMQSAIRVLV